MTDKIYDQFVRELREVVAGRRGWVSLTHAARAIGINRGQLHVVARALGLTITQHGKYGYCATRAAEGEKS